MIAVAPLIAPRGGRQGRFAMLTEEERRLYERIPPDVDYVDHDCFASPTAEARLWGPERREIPVVPYCLAEVRGAAPRARRRRSSLTAEEEQTLFLRYNYAKYRLSKLLKHQRRCFSPGLEREILAWHRRAQEVRTKIVHANLALVPAMVKRVNVSNVDFGEMISEGDLAVLKCVEKFDVSRGYKFSTYAWRSILGYLRRLSDRSLRYSRRFSVSFEPGMEPADRPDPRHEDQRHEAVRALREILRHNLARLNQVERRVVLERFAIWSGSGGRTLSEVSRIVGLSPERVRQIEKRSLSKLRAALERHLAA